ncbi:thioredoxin-like protein [Mucilaginibacter gracilis]|uniref:Thioredoxin-like protein n=1 Tax=Mucilaginibacter gracilis TaxID=423350 RepID=A0A495IZB2_9SPHI|nr:cysteine peptidase family C39 domain-containing protein [Mucilaginibacter gracilis]RKR82056.1 thioredoxin-like protein [Mucilaginibacter gracilis]
MLQLIIKYGNIDFVTIKLLKLLRKGVSYEDVINELEKHPDYPSLLTISDVLNWFQIDNAAYRVNAEELNSVPVPFIAHTNVNDDFVLVTKLGEDGVTISDHKSNKQKLSLSEFKKRFKGVVLTAEAPLNGESVYKQSLPQRLAPYKFPAAISILTICFALAITYHSSYLSNLNWQVLLLSIFKSAGLVTSILLLIQSIDKNNPLVQTLCGASGSKTNCNAILTSKAATVFEGLSWSEVGFFFFAGTWLAILFGGNSVAVMQVLAVLNVVSLPYTVYSINYQARIARQWCLFCTFIQGLLWLEFIPLVTIFKQPIQLLNTAQTGTLIICLLAPIALWLLIKPMLLNTQQLKAVKQQLRKVKYNSQLFYSALKEQPKYVLPHEDWSIVLGNIEANTIITMVSNPYCPPCSKTHQILDEWLNRLDDIQLRIVFTANNNESDIKTSVVRHLMALNHLTDKTLIKRALHDWYEQKQKSYEAWAKVYPVTLDESKFKVLERQRAWCDLAEVKATPTILVNGSRLPDSYQLHDIKYMLAQQ